MIQLLVMALALGVFLYDSMPHGTPPGGGSIASAAWALGWMLLPKLVVAGLLAWAMALCRRELILRGRLPRRWLERVGLVYRICVIALYLLDVAKGGLGLVRLVMGDWVLLDELAFMVPTVALLAWAWWCYYPIDRRLRGVPIPGPVAVPLQTRGQYLLGQMRHQVVIVLAPMLALMGWHEIVARVPATAGWLHIDLRPALLLAGSGCVFFFAPVMIRFLWDTTPLPAGEVRDGLLEMCRIHHVRVKQILLWRTFNTMVNAAVMGFLAPVRYILLSDSLLEQMRPLEIEAVMAHELAHIRKHHIFWLAIVALASMSVFQEVWLWGFAWFAAMLPPPDTSEAIDSVTNWLLRQFATREGQELVSVLPTLVCWALILGWVSRRFERQADSFAVQHLARRYGEVHRAIALAQQQERAAAANAEATQTLPPSPPAPAPSANAAALADLGLSPAEIPAASSHWPATLPPGQIDPRSAALMVRALKQVADLNLIPITKPSWRHGSIAWRQQYLWTLVGLPTEQLTIDRTVRLIKIAAATVLIVVLVWQA